MKHINIPGGGGAIQKLLNKQDFYLKGLLCYHHHSSASRTVGGFFSFFKGPRNSIVPFFVHYLHWDVFRRVMDVDWT